MNLRTLGIRKSSPLRADHPGTGQRCVLCKRAIRAGDSFRIEPGEAIAVVGHTGAGKTTLTNLPLRFYDIQRGSIRIGGVDIREFALAGLRRHFGIVLQDPYLFTGTVETNIRLGSPGIARDVIEEAARKVNLLDFVRSLPKGFAQPVRERGNGYSTGQEQLIGSARALAHNPRFLILDEAASSVYTETSLECVMHWRNSWRAALRW